MKENEFIEIKGNLTNVLAACLIDWEDGARILEEYQAGTTDSGAELEEAESVALGLIESFHPDLKEQDKFCNALGDCVYYARRFGLERGIRYGFRLALDLLGKPIQE